MKILVPGGAGYIGAVTVAHLVGLGHEVHVLDDLSTGHRESVAPEAFFHKGRVQDETLLDAVLVGIEAVVHFAALSLVGESMRAPLHYIRENLSGAWSLMAAMERTGVKRLVFSSTAATYGEPELDVIDESSPTHPINPYGHSKLMIEYLIAEQSRARGLGAISLRYFNACGAAGALGEHHEPETHLIPRLCMHLLGRCDDFAVFGSDFPTPDGTPIRDYVHVRDLAQAHGLALGAIRDGQAEVINLGTGHGASVREVLAVAGAVTGRALEITAGPRRKGDPACLVASNSRAADRLGWKPHHSQLEEILASAWAWHRNHPQGYCTPAS